jgi:hypothetical protein
MPRKITPRAGFALLGSIIVLLAGCSTASEPGVTSPADSVDGRPAWSGTYDFTATFQTYTAPDPASACSIGDCPHKTVAAPGSSSLAGSLVLGAGLAQANASLRYPVASFVLSELDCRLSTSCFARTVKYDDNPAITVLADTLLQMATLGASGESVYLDTGRMAGDSITGSVNWYVFFGVASQYYGGTYVARRRR